MARSVEIIVSTHRRRRDGMRHPNVKVGLTKSGALGAATDAMQGERHTPGAKARVCGRFCCRG